MTELKMGRFKPLADFFLCLQTHDHSNDDGDISCIELFTKRTHLGIAILLTIHFYASILSFRFNCLKTFG